MSRVRLNEKKQKIAEVGKNTIGYIDGDDVYIIPNKAYAYAKSVLQKSGSNFALPELDLMRRLRDEKVLLAKEKGKLKSKLSVNGNRLNLYKFKKSTFGPGS